MNMAAMAVAGWGRSMAAAAFDGGHAATSSRATRGRVGSTTRGREGGATRGNTTTSRRKMTRWWRSKRTMRGRDGGATRGHATTRRRDETTRGRRSERTTRGRECGETRGWKRGGHCRSVCKKMLTLRWGYGFTKKKVNPPQADKIERYC